MGLTMKQQFTTYESISPSVAEMYLQKNVINRPISPTLIRKYAVDMQAGRWRTTHQGIAFDMDGLLRDGQHRLKAIIISGKTVVMAVTRNMSEAACSAIDNGRARTFTDNESFKGIRLPREYSPTLTGLLLGEGAKTTQLSHTALAEIAQKHDAAIRFAIGCFDGECPKGIRVGPVMGVVARAYYGKPHERLRQFGQVMSSGIPNGPEDYAAIRLRNWRLESRAGRAEIYRKTERALLAFVERQQLTKLYDAPEELFPLPKENEGEAVTAVM